MRQLRYLLAGLLVVWDGSALAEPCIWYADGHAIHQVDSTTNEVRRSVTLNHPQRLLMNAADCGVWALDRHERRLLRFNAEGLMEREIRLRNLGARLDEAEEVAFDPYDGSLWLRDAQHIVHVSGSGRLLKSLRAPGTVRRLGVALDQGLWVLGTRDLWHFDREGTLLAAHRLQRHLASDARHFAIDSLGGYIWLADEHDLARIRVSDPQAAPLRLRARHSVEALALDPLTGRLWVAHKRELRAYARGGTLERSVDLDALALRDAEQLAFDPVGGALWLRTKHAVSRLSDTGALLARLAARDDDAPIGVPAFRLDPSLALIGPPENAVTNNPRPVFTLGYGAQCPGLVCTLAPEYFGAYRLGAQLDGVPVADAFVFHAPTGEASYIPAAPLAEGPHSFRAQVTDAFGHTSNEVRSRLTIDTVAPRFLSITPANGSFAPSAQITLQGTVDDPGATVLLDGRAAANPSAAGGILSFAFPVTLAPGPNLFALSAIDPAGNATRAALTLTLAGFYVSIASPADGATIDGDTVLVTGSFSGSANTGITVNGTVAAVAGNDFYAQVALHPGGNTLVVQAASADGQSASQTVNVVSSRASSIRLAAQPASGIAPAQVGFTLSNNTGYALTRIEVDFDGDGNIDFSTGDPSAAIATTYTLPGVYLARVRASVAGGASYEATTTVVVETVAAVDARLRAVYTGMLERLRVGDVEGALLGVTAAMRGKYRNIFSTLGAELPNTINQLGTIRDGTINQEFAEYVLVRETPAGPRAYLIYLIRCEDGVWRIDGM